MSHRSLGQFFVANLCPAAVWRGSLLFSFYCSQSPFNVLCTPNKTRVPCILLCKKVKLILWLFYEYFLRSRRNFQLISTKNWVRTFFVVTEKSRSFENSSKFTGKYWPKKVSFKPWTGVYLTMFHFGFVIGLDIVRGLLPDPVFTDLQNMHWTELKILNYGSMNVRTWYRFFVIHQ